MNITVTQFTKGSPGRTSTGWIGIQLEGWSQPIWFRHEFKDDHAPVEVARAVTDTIRKAFQDRLRLIREEAYEKGWKDAKSKRRKLREFFASWKSEFVGY